VLVATGRAEIMLDPAMNPWDSAPLLPILREAGGHFSDWQGTPTIWTGEAMATNAALRDPVLDILRAEQRR
jgi:fructose-1,6-bisphosphatase/inositol monophosphatase family enzyme